MHYHNSNNNNIDLRSPGIPHRIPLESVATTNSSNVSLSNIWLREVFLPGGFVWKVRALCHLYGCFVYTLSKGIVLFFRTLVYNIPNLS